MASENSRTFIWHFDSPAERIWPVLADTARFNEAAELPKHDIEEIARPDGSVLYIGRARVGPLTIAWDDQPANWVERRWFRHCRYFQGSPFLSLCATFRLFAEDGGCRGEYTAAVAPRNRLGRLILALGFLAQSGRKFARLAASARDFGSGRRSTEFDHRPPRLAPGAEARLPGLVNAIDKSDYGHGLAARLADYVTTRQEVDVWAIRPLKLAALWRVPERHAIEACLEAARQGLLGLRWDMLCPRCQVGKETAPSLDKLPRGAHCDSCNIDYERDYTKNIELAFQPSVAIRPIEAGQYCLYGPMSTPHVKVQITLAAGETRAEPIDLYPGRYRLRTLEPGGEESLEWTGGGFPEIIADGDSVRAGGPAPAGEVRLRNASSRRLTLVLEEREWARHALTAERVFALQSFRDLFSRDVLRPGDNVEIDHVSLMFTDLKGSTALYDRLGDPEAYALVRAHYAVLGKAVRECDGAIVKTIGDAIMAVFDEPAAALRCAFRIHADVAAFNATSAREPITIKLGLHVGRCISVTLNERLDYYGSAANKAARLEGQSRGGDVVMSAEFAADPAVAVLLDGLALARESAELKGFAAPVPFVRVAADEVARVHAGA